MSGNVMKMTIRHAGDDETGLTKFDITPGGGVWAGI